MWGEQECISSLWQVLKSGTFEVLLAEAAFPQLRQPALLYLNYSRCCWLTGIFSIQESDLKKIMKNPSFGICFEKLFLFTDMTLS